MIQYIYIVLNAIYMRKSILIGLLLAIVSILVMAVLVSRPTWSQTQSTPLFTVNSPTNGQVFHPGDKVTFIVTPRANVTLGGLRVISRIGDESREPASPIQFQIPTSTESGPLMFMVLGATNTEAAKFKRTIAIEPVVAATQISASPSIVVLAIPGSSQTFTGLGDDRIAVDGIFGDGTRADVSSLPDCRFTSSNLRVATVADGGIVTAVAPGVATITVIYQRLTATVTVKVNVFPLRGDLDGDGDVDQDDINFLMKALNTPATGLGDPRDLNGDNKIDALDARVLTTLCSRIHCANESSRGR